MKFMTAMLTAVAALNGSPVAAQTAPAETAVIEPMRIANGTRFGQWVVNCEALAVNETACVLSQRLVRRTDNVFLAELMMFWDPEGKRSFLAARVPGGAYLPSGFAFRVAEGEGEETRLIWQTCGRDLCEALIEMPLDALPALEGDAGLVAGYRPGIVAEPIVFAFSAKGAGEGMTALHASLGKAGE